MLTTEHTCPATSAQAEAIIRWEKGHQIFHIELVTMNSLLDAALEALVRGEDPYLHKILHQLTMLFDAATATFIYTSDFSPENYNNHVRPSMMPPVVKPGFSGILNTEHKIMKTKIRQLRQNLEKEAGLEIADCSPETTNAWNLFLQAQKRNQQLHGLVCQKFVPQGVSLLKQYYKEEKP